MGTREGDAGDADEAPEEAQAKARRLGWVLFLVVLVLFLTPLIWKLSLE